MIEPIYNIDIHRLDGSVLTLGQYKDKKLLIVNVASECGLTPQYTQLQELYELYNDKLEIIGVPCDDFGHQEPGSHEEIGAFCTKNYGVTFSLTQKISILSDTHPLYLYLTQKALNGFGDFSIEWNFHKFLIDENGKLLASYASVTSPLSDEILVHFSEENQG
jgi:glutathione peroxidase